jgi:hypothetical protein
MIPASVQQLFRLPADPALLLQGNITGTGRPVARDRHFQLVDGLPDDGPRPRKPASAACCTCCACWPAAWPWAAAWAMHFIGMLAFELCTSVDYDRA